MISRTQAYPRFEGFQTNGSLPSGWRLCKLGDVVRFESGTFLEREQINELDQFPVYGANGVIGFTAKPLFTEPRITVGRVGSCGAVNRTVANCWITDNTIVCYPSPEVEFDFLLYFLKSTNLSALRSSSIQPLLTQKAIRHIPIPLPPLAEQKRIVAILNEQMAAVDKARAAAETQLEAAKALPAAYLREVFPKGEPGKAPLPEGWRWEELGRILDETRNGLYKPDDYYGQGTPILKMFNIGRLDGAWELQRVDRILLTEEEACKYRLLEGDILLNRVNSRELVGKSAVVNAKTVGAVFESKNMRLRVSLDRACPRFVSIYLNSEFGRKQFLERLKQIVGQATVNRSDLATILIPLPSLAEQKRIVAILNEQMAATQKLTNALETQLNEITALPAAFLRQAFSGAL